MENDEYGVTVAYSDPYGVYLPQDLLDKLGIDSGDPVNLVFSGEDDESEIVAKAKKQDVVEDNGTIPPLLKEEIHALFYGIAQIIDELPEGFEETFDRFLGEQPTEVQIDEFQELAAYLEEIQTNVVRFERDNVVVGCGFFEIFLKGVRETDQQHTVKTPLFQIDTPTFKELLDGQFPDLVDIEPYEEEIGEPDTVYFCTEYFSTSEKQRERLREQLTEQEFFLTGGDYIFPYHYITAHGPLHTERLQEQPSLIRLTPDAIEFTGAQFGQILPVEEDTEFAYDQFAPILEDLFDQEGTEIESSPDENTIVFNVDDIRLTFQVFEGELRYSYLHVTDPDTVEVIEDALNALPEFLDDELGIKTGKLPTETNELAGNVDRETWVMDTNALYHEIPGRGPSSIMHLFLPNTNLYGKQITVPWQVIAEINRHKDGPSTVQTASEKGIENLRILRLLDHYGFVELDIEDIPPELDTSIDPDTGATDLAILEAVNAAEDAVLVTRDERLIDLCGVMDTPVEHVEFLTTLQPKEEDRDVFEAVRQELQTPQEREDVIGHIHEGLQIREETSELVDHHSDRGYSGDAQTLLQNWLDGRRVITYPARGCMYVAQSEPLDIVPSFRLLEKLTGYITSDGEKYLTEEFLEAMKQAIHPPPNCYPWIHFHIPEEFVYQALDKRSEHDDELVKTLYQVEQVVNAEYSSVPLIVEEERDPRLEKIAVRAAKEEGCTLVCLENEDIIRLARLLGVPISSIRLDP